MSYDEFRTGMTFQDVRDILTVESWRVHRTTGNYMFVTRHTVLGKWREIKLAMYDEYIQSLEPPF